MANKAVPLREIADGALGAAYVAPFIGIGAKVIVGDICRAPAFLRLRLDLQ